MLLRREADPAILQRTAIDQDSNGGSQPKSNHNATEKSRLDPEDTIDREDTTVQKQYRDLDSRYDGKIEQGAEEGKFQVRGMRLRVECCRGLGINCLLDQLLRIRVYTEACRRLVGP